MCRYKRTTTMAFTYVAFQNMCTFNKYIILFILSYCLYYLVVYTYSNPVEIPPIISFCNW